MKVNFYFLTVIFMGKQINWSAYGPTEEMAKKRAIRRMTEEFSLINAIAEDFKIIECEFVTEMEVNNYEP